MGQVGVGVAILLTPTKGGVVTLLCRLLHPLTPEIKVVKVGVRQYRDRSLR